MNKVTCIYCEYFNPLYTFYYPEYTMSPFGLCELKSNCRKQNARICDNFKLRRGMHTSKWYPNKMV